MNQHLEEQAQKLCRDVGVATMMVGIMPGLGALTGLVVMPLVEPEAEVTCGCDAGAGTRATWWSLVLAGVAWRRRDGRRRA